MRYIPGTQFKNNTKKFTKYFNPGLVYTLKRVKIVEEGIKYIFGVSDKSNDKEITFKTTQEADGFLDTMR
jgi:hypothetical protein